MTQLTGSWPTTLETPSAWLNNIPVMIDADQTGKFELNWDDSPSPVTLELEFFSSIDWSHSDFRWAIPLQF